MLSSFKDLKPDEVFANFSRLLMDYQFALSKLSERIENNDPILEQENIILILEKIHLPIDQAILNLQNIQLTCNNPLWTLFINRMFGKMRNVRREYFTFDESIYTTLIKLRNSDNLTVSNKALLDLWLSECFYEGSGLLIASNKKAMMNSKVEKGRDVLDADKFNNMSPGKAVTELQTLIDLQERLLTEENNFGRMTFLSASVSGPEFAKSRYTGRIGKPSDLVFYEGIGQVPIAESDLASSAPEWLPSLFGGVQNGGHIANMRVNMCSDEIINLALKHCSTREIRQQIWFYYVQRATARVFGPGSGQHADNESRIEDIRHFRKCIANNLGYNDWLSFRWRSPFSHSPESPEWLIENVLESARNHLLPCCQNEFKLLNDWAGPNLHMIGSQLEPWDIDYVIEQYNYATMYAEAQININLPQNSLTKHLDSILTELTKLFQLNLIRQPYSLSDEKNVMHYYLEDMADGKFLGEIIVDLFHDSNNRVISDGQICLPTVLRSDATNLFVKFETAQHPIANLVCSYDVSKEREGLTYSNYLSIISTFGLCLQHVACTVGHHSLSGLCDHMNLEIKYLTKDVISLILRADILETFKNPFILSNKTYYSQPAPTGLKPPLKPIISIPYMQLVYKSRFDLALWMYEHRRDHWTKLNRTLFEHHMPYPFHNEYTWPCSASYLFASNNQSCFVYQRFWQHVLLEDIRHLLSEAGLYKNLNSNKQVIELLNRFRHTYWTLGASIPPNELFRRFSGRDPNINSFVKVHRYVNENVDKVETGNANYVYAQ